MVYFSYFDQLSISTSPLIEHQSDPPSQRVLDEALLLDLAREVIGIVTYQEPFILINFKLQVNDVSLKKKTISFKNLERIWRETMDLSHTQLHQIIDVGGFDFNSIEVAHFLSLCAAAISSVRRLDQVQSIFLKSMFQNIKETMIRVCKINEYIKASDFVSIYQYLVDLDGEVGRNVSENAIRWIQQKSEETDEDVVTIDMLTHPDCPAFQ